MIKICALCFDLRPRISAPRMPGLTFDVGAARFDPKREFRNWRHATWI